MQLWGFFLPVILNTVSHHFLFLPASAILPCFTTFYFTSLISCTVCPQLCWILFLFLRVLKNLFFFFYITHFFVVVFQFRSTYVTASIFAVSTVLFGGFQPFFTAPVMPRGLLCLCQTRDHSGLNGCEGCSEAGEKRGISTLSGGEAAKYYSSMEAPVSSLVPCLHPTLCCYNSPYDSK